MKKLLIGLVSFGLALGALGAGQSLQDNDAASPSGSSVIFGPAPGGGQTRIKSILAKSGDAAGEVQIFARSGNRAAPTSNSTNGAQVINVSNAGNVFTTNDYVAYVHANSSVDYTTVSANSTGTVTLAAGISSAGASGDYLYELSKQGVQLIATTALNLAGDSLFVSPSDSPVRVLNTGTNATYLTVTVDK